MNIKIGTLVRHENDHYDHIGIVVDDINRSRMPNLSSEYKMVQVRWLDGMGEGIYWTDELEVVCE